MHNRKEIWAITLGAVIGALPGLAMAHWGGVLLAGVAGAILGWAWSRKAVLAAVRGAAIGALFLLFAGPGVDRLVRGRPILERARHAAVAGAMVGAFLGVRNFRIKKAIEAENRAIGAESSGLTQAVALQDGAKLEVAGGAAGARAGAKPQVAD